LEFEGEKYSIKFLKDGVYQINDKTVGVDFKNERFVPLENKAVSAVSLLQFLFYPEEAEAAVPAMLIYFAVISGVMVISFSCAGQNINRYFNVGDSFSSKTVRAQSARLRRMNQALNEAIASVVPFCAGAANASVADLGLEYVNYERVFSDYCDQMAEASAERAARTARSRRDSYIASTQAFSEDGSFNSDFENELTRAPNVYGIGNTRDQFLESMSFEICSTTACRDRNPETVAFSDLSETSQQVILAHLQDPDFSRSCTLDSLERMGERNVRSFRDISEITDETGSLD
jgi:hypothetical protein